jgi:multidrug resistance efflux pump
MTTLTVDPNYPAQVGPVSLESSVAGGGHKLLRELQQRLLRVVTTSVSKEAVISGVATVVAETTEPTDMVYLERNASGHWSEQHLLHGTQERIAAKLKQQLTTWCDDACRHGCVQINAIDLPHGGIAVTAPIMLKCSPPDAFATVYRQAKQPVDRLVVVHQLIAAHIALWQVLGQAKEAEFEAQTTASLMELLTNLETAGDLDEACSRLVNELKDHLSCQRVALALCGRGKNHCQLVALSGMDRFDQRSEIVRVMEAALNEAVVRDCLTVWPATDDAQGQGGLAHDKLRSTTAAGCVVSCPLHDDEQCLVGAWLFLGEVEFAQDQSNLNFIEASGRPIGARVRLLQNSQRGRIARLLQTVIGQSRTTRRKLAVTLLCLLFAILWLPLPYKIHCQCTVEPVVRRVVAAPYDGILQKTHVEPGDIVQRNEVLARMDGREIEWELAGLDAEYNRAKKERDATLADDEVAAAQRARLEMRQLDLKRKLLQHRESNLEVKSPIDGIVISGDLEKVEGAPLTIGDSLFEIAPLDKLLVELAIADREITHVPDGGVVEIRLEAYPWRKWEGTITNIWPRSEVREQENVFIAEVTLDNSDLQLRPGMKGRGKIIGRQHPLAWNLFHKPCESLLLWIGW